MKTPLERIRWVMKDKGWSERKWATEAKLKEPSNLNKLIKRLKERPDEVPGDIKTFVKLADAAGVSLDWLLLGRGQPYTGPSIADDPKYPTRAIVVAAGRMMDFPQAAIEALLAFDAGPDDPGRDYWFRLLDGKRTEFSLPQLPKPSEPPQLGH